MRVEVVGVLTNKTPTGAYRGAGGPEAGFCMERTVDLIAQELNLDPAEVRRRNLIAPVAVANAVMDALSSVGVRHIDTPLTTEKIWRALHGAVGR